MSQEKFYKCDKCGKHLTFEQESNGAIAISAGSTCASLCEDCQRTTTVFEAKGLAKRVLAEAQQIANPRAVAR